MKSFFICIIIFCLSALEISAQDSSEIKLKQSAFALQFQIGNDFTLKSFQGSTLSCKYHIFDKSAIRVGVSLSSNIDTYKEENNVVKDGDESFDMTINSQLIQYIGMFDDISLFIGGGPQYYKSYYRDGTSPYNRNYWSLGMSGILGVEWFFKKNMSLSAEYGIVFYYKEEKGTNLYGDSYSVKSYNTSDFNMLKFGLSVYL